MEPRLKRDTRHITSSYTVIHTISDFEVQAIQPNLSCCVQTHSILFLQPDSDCHFSAKQQVQILQLHFSIVDDCSFTVFICLRRARANEFVYQTVTQATQPIYDLSKLGLCIRYLCCCSLCNASLLRRFMCQQLMANIHDAITSGSNRPIVCRPYGSIIQIHGNCNKQT